MKLERKIRARSFKTGRSCSLGIFNLLLRHWEAFEGLPANGGVIRSVCSKDLFGEKQKGQEQTWQVQQARPKGMTVAMGRVARF